MDLISDDDDEATIRLSRDELRILGNGLNEILNGPSAIPDWEFGTRVGASPADARQLLASVHRVNDALDRGA